jgi:hypothetical protein
MMDWMAYVFLLNRPWVGPQERLPPGLVGIMNRKQESCGGGTQPHIAVEQGTREHRLAGVLLRSVG